MKRHLYAYLIVIAIYIIPQLVMSPSGWLYFVSIASWSWISAVIYLKFIRLRCATILCMIEVIISSCAIIALCEYYLLGRNWYFYSNLESILDSLIVLEVLVITISLTGAAIGLSRISGYNNANRPIDNRGANSN